MIEITLQPTFWLSLLRQDVDTLMRLSEYHYDSVCRMAGKPGHFLYGWFNITREQSPCGDHKIEGVPTCSGSHRDLDTVLKICEGRRLALSSRILTADEVRRMEQLCSLIFTAFETALLVIKVAETKLEPITAPSLRGSLMGATTGGGH